MANAKKHSFNVDTWTLCVACDLSAPELQWWNQWSKAKMERYNLSIKLMANAEILEILKTANAKKIKNEFFGKNSKNCKKNINITKLDKSVQVNAKKLHVNGDIISAGPNSTIITQTFPMLSPLITENKTQCETFANRAKKYEDYQEILKSINKYYIDNENPNFLSEQYSKKYMNFGNSTIFYKVLSGKIIDSDIKESFQQRIETKSQMDLLYWLADIFHLLDFYFDAQDILKNAVKIENGKFSNQIDVALLDAHILTHLNMLGSAKSKYQLILGKKISITQKVECLFRLGEISVTQGNFSGASNYFSKSMNTISTRLDACHENHEIQKLHRFQADNLRKMGTSNLIQGDSQFALQCYHDALEIYSVYGSRGQVWILHGLAEYKRFSGELSEALRSYTYAKQCSEDVLNFNRVAHALLGQAEVYRLQKEFKKSIRIYNDCYERYREINSEWGLANTLLGRGMTYLSNDNEEQGKIDLSKAKFFCRKIGLNNELNIIREVNSGVDTDEIFHPLSFF